jgi:hypothetical protein
MPGPNRPRGSGGPLEADLNSRHPLGGIPQWRQAAGDSAGVWEWVGQTARWVRIFSMPAGCSMAGP